MLRRLTLMIALTLVPFSATFAGAASARTASYALPPVLSVATRGGLTVVKSFKAPAHLTGWIMKSQSGRYIPLFTTPDGKILIAGALVNTAGVNLSAMYQHLYAPKTNLTALWKRFKNSAYFIDGATKHTKHIIYVVMDPNCIFCHMFWIATRPYVAAGLQIRWIPVGFLRPSSTTKAAELLVKGNAAMIKAEKNFNVPKESAGIKGITPTPAIAAKLKANFALMRAAQVTGTPGIFYKDANGQVKRQIGLPALSLLPSITGIKAQPETNPSLLQFVKRF